MRYWKKSNFKVLKMIKAIFLTLTFPIHLYLRYRKANKMLALLFFIQHEHISKATRQRIALWIDKNLVTLSIRTVFFNLKKVEKRIDRLS